MKRLNRLARARPAQARGPGPPPGVEAELTLAEMGARGDAVARLDGARVYAPFTLPGERVRARVMGERAEVLEFLAESPERVDAPCRLFGICGGCQLQHWEEGARLAWKRDEVVRALARRRVEAEVEPALAAWGEGRRRATLHAERVGRRVALGFMERGGARIQALEACPALAPALEAALPALVELGALFAPPRGEVTLACFIGVSGIDVNLKGAGRLLARDREVLERAAKIAEAHDLARISLDGDTVIMRRRPIVRMGEVLVDPPPGAFLQPTFAGEAAIAALVMPALQGAKRIIDLFSGCGPFALRAAAIAPTHAVDSEAPMLEALKRAADAANLNVTVERRDLFRTPVAALEMKRFDAAILDPPRAGARLQTEQLAASKITRIASVSCDPATFARDARILIDAGFRLTRVTPIDQFRWSAHIEIVGAFER
ncbi:MAG: class I SAM-dependent RNA methyltransferase [Hyphomonadaceae bacterium]|nr:class I SAM-dependent RNA methyltransferase [Hyphomonadaceae bacterium]